MTDRRNAPKRRSPGDEASYSLSELTALAQVTVRTVRYYIAEGLLPPPVGAGPHARYTRRHLDRLLLIARLKDAFMPLKEIRRRLQGMSDAEIHEAAHDTTMATSRAAPPPEMQMAEAPDSAADYIGRVLREQAPPYTASSAQSSRSRAVRRREPVPEASWRRIPITDEAELLITDEAHHRRRDQIEAALDWLRRILNER
jgi:DNA-binding transcriptional MerR regulator